VIFHHTTRGIIGRNGSHSGSAKHKALSSFSNFTIAVRNVGISSDKTIRPAYSYDHTRNHGVAGADLDHYTVCRVRSRTPRSYEAQWGFNSALDQEKLTRSLRTGGDSGISMSRGGRRGTAMASTRERRECVPSREVGGQRGVGLRRRW
jgi:hypothetical protein